MDMLTITSALAGLTDGPVSFYWQTRRKRKQSKSSPDHGPDHDHEKFNQVVVFFSKTQ